MPSNNNNNNNNNNAVALRFSRCCFTRLRSSAAQPQPQRLRVGRMWIALRGSTLNGAGGLRSHSEFEFEIDSMCVCVCVQLICNRCAALRFAFFVVVFFLAAASTSASFALGTLCGRTLNACVCVCVCKGSEGSFIWAAGGNFCGVADDRKTMRRQLLSLPSSSSFFWRLLWHRKKPKTTTTMAKIHVCCALKLVSLYTCVCVCLGLRVCVCA